MENNFEAVITVKEKQITIKSKLKKIDEKFFLDNIQNIGCKKIEIDNEDYWIIQKDNMYIIDKFHCLNQTIEEYEKNAIYDSLTGCYNKKETEVFINKLFNSYLRYRRDPFSILMLDIDYFKKINDIYGHLAGDKALKEMANIVFKLIRQSDIFGRYGGEEFLIVLPSTKITGAMKLAQRIKDSVENNVVDFNNQKIRFTVSIGATSVGINDTYESLIARADEALYEAKAKGRNRIEYR